MGLFEGGQPIETGSGSDQLSPEGEAMLSTNGVDMKLIQKVIEDQLRQRANGVDIDAVIKDVQDIESQLKKGHVQASGSEKSEIPAPATSSDQSAQPSDSQTPATPVATPAPVAPADQSQSGGDQSQSGSSDQSQPQ